jgi:DNA-directed RNA polymerase subunit RPC12/RpoP
MSAYYSDWQTQVYACGKCGWRGKGGACQQGEIFSELFEICCPECGEKVGLVMFPTFAESRQNWHKVSDLDKKAVEIGETLQKDFASRRLNTPDQLPDLEGDDLILIWDTEKREGGDVLIKYGERVIWRETGFYENYERFAEMVALLKQKYGNRLQDLVPTRKSQLYLYGDSLSASDRVTKARASMEKQK